MFAVHVFFNVKQENIEAFKSASVDNVSNSRKEAGIIHFDLLQQQEDKTKFILYEVYRSTEDQLKHRETDHYKKWRETILDLLAEPYSFMKLDYINPAGQLQIV